MKKILIIGLALLVGTAIPAFSGDLFTVKISTEAVDSILSRAELYTNYNFSTSNATLTTETFSIPSNDSNDINVSLTNDSNAECKVTLYKVGLRKDRVVGSFIVPAKTAKYSTFSGNKSNVYYVKVTADSGAPIKGSLQVRQI